MMSKKEMLAYVVIVAVVAIVMGTVVGSWRFGVAVVIVADPAGALTGWLLLQREER